MARIRIKRSTGSTAPSSSDLANAELAFTEGNDILYYGEGTSGSDAASVIKIGGSGAFVDLTTAQTVAGDKTFSDDVTVTGNLTVNGTTTTVSTTNTKVSDNLLELNTGAGSNANDCGILIERGSTGDNAIIAWDESVDKFTVGTTTNTHDDTGNLTISTGTLVANLEGNVTGNVTGNTSGSAGSFTAGSASNLNSGTIPAARIGDDSITEAKLDIHAAPSGTDKVLGYTANGMEWVAQGGGLSQEQVEDVVGAMFSSNTETGITATYQDSDGTIDLVVGTLNQDTTGTSAGLTGTPDITVGDVTAASLDISGDADIDGTMEADAYTVNGTTLAEYISDTVGAMISGNTETGITVSYQDSDNTLDFVVGTLNQDTTGTAAIATTVTVADESSDTSCNVLFTTSATGDLAPKSGTNLTFNSSSGALTATSFVGALTGNVTGNTSGSSGSCTGNSATATTSTNVTVADESSDTTCFPLFATAATGDLAPKSGSNLTFNSSTGQLDFTVLDGGTW